MEGGIFPVCGGFFTFYFFWSFQLFAHLQGFSHGCAVFLYGKSSLSIVGCSAEPAWAAGKAWGGGLQPLLPTFRAQPLLRGHLA